LEEKLHFHSPRPRTSTATGLVDAARPDIAPVDNVDPGNLGRITRYMTPAQVADMLGVSVRTLCRWHLLRIGPPRCEVGKLRLYRQTSVEGWLASQESEPVRARRGKGGRS
jgi:hypothetical protein